MWVGKLLHKVIVSLNQIFILSSQKEYVCFDFLLKHHNIIRFRRSSALITDDFDTVCSSAQFPTRDGFKYELFLGDFFI